MFKLTDSECGRLEHIPDEGSRNNSGVYERYTNCNVKCTLRLPSIRSRNRLGQVKAYTYEIGESYRLHWNISDASCTIIKSGSSWMSSA